MLTSPPERLPNSGQPQTLVSVTLILLVGLASVPTYLYAWSQQNLREHTAEFLVAFTAAFIFYAFATILAVRPPGAGLQRRPWLLLAGLFGLALIFNAFLIFTPPTLSDDMYRYVWDGRVQAQGIHPYRYAPADSRLSVLREAQIWRWINRKTAVTVYPPAAEMVFAGLWQVFPDNVRWFQAFMAGMSLLAGGLLAGLLRDLGRSPIRLLIYLWSPLLIYETAHSAHADALILPLIVGAWWARVRQRDGLVGALLGLAAAIKFYPAFLLPALWRPQDPQGRWRLPLAFGVVFAACYLPYLAWAGVDVLGFLPNYLGENFNLSPLVRWLLYNIPHEGLAQSQQRLQLVALGLLALAGIWMTLRPARNGESALRRCIWPMGIFILFNPNLFSWYLLWLLPLLAIFVQPGTLRWRGQSLPFGLRLDAWSGWWLFSGLLALSYTFFFSWDPLPWAVQVQFWPLYLFLAVDLLRRVFAWRRSSEQVVMPSSGAAAVQGNKQ